MLVIHELKLIFVRPQKVASTSLTEALIKYVGYKRHDTVRALQKATSNSGILLTDISQLHHAPCHKLKAITNRDIWDNYLKISIIRCPYDLMISNYYWHSFHERGIDKIFNLYVLQKTSEAFIRNNYMMLCIDNQLAIDFLMKYENLHEDIKKLEKLINCPGLLELYNQDHWMKNVRLPGQDVDKVYAKYQLARAIIDKDLTEAMGNKLIRKYYPMYKKKLDQRVPESSYFLIKIAGLLIYLYKYEPYIKKYLKNIPYINKCLRKLQKHYSAKPVKKLV